MKLPSAFFAVSLILIGAQNGPAAVVDEIRTEATAPNSATNHPLPLFSLWRAGNVWKAPNDHNVTSPLWQLDMINQGHYLLPTLQGPDMDMMDPNRSAYGSTQYFYYYQEAMQKAASLNLPLRFLVTQWEQRLTKDPKYVNLPYNQNPLKAIPGKIPGKVIGRVEASDYYWNWGVGYKVGDILSIRGGIHKRPAKVQVMQVSNEKYAYHGILKVRVIDGGDYTALPANSYPQQMASAEGGAGTGARFFVYDGAYEPVLSAFGSTNAWMQLGAEWYSQTNNVGGKSMASYLQDWYPNPPFLQFLSNNEAPLENITDPGINLDINTDKRYLNLYGSGQTDDFKREKLGEGWISHYRTMMNAMKDALTPAWRGKARFIGYEAFGPGCFGRWGGWKAYSFYIPNRISPHPLMWDGGTPSYYLWNIPGYQTWQQDYLLNSPQMEAMNYPFMLDEAYGLNLDFWFDLSTWNGASSGANSNVGYLASLGQTYTPERYAGMVQFGMWLTRPRAITDFNSADPGGADALPYIMSLVNAVDRVHTDPVLKSFWRQSDLVPNTARPCPYQSDIPPEYANTNRMFMLSTNLDPAQPWTGGATEFPVFYLARLKDNGSGNRVWLVYGFSPK